MTDANNNTTVSTHDALNRLVQVCQPFINGSSQVCAPGNGHPAVTVLKYDANGNLTSQVSPRGYDAAPAPKTSFSDFVTSYHYDALNRLVRTDLPVQGTSPHYYVHNGYDSNGNLVSSSLPVTTSDPTQVAPSSKTQLTYFDPGWIASSQDPGGPRIHFDYTGKGEQRQRTPESSSGTAQVIHWSYFPDGKLKERKDQKDQPVTYTYDAENHLTASHDASGLTTPQQTFIDTQSAYDDLGRLVRSDLKKQSNTNWTFSTFAYDADNNVTDQVQNGQESSPGGTPVKAGRSLHTDYDGADWITTQFDYGTDPGSADDQRTLNTFTPIGLELTREIDKSNGPGVWTRKQLTTWGYFANGKLQSLTTTGAGQSQPLEQHTVSYLDPSGIYVDGNRTQDTFSLKPGNSSSGACYPTACTATYTYDPRDRLVGQNDGRGSITTYDLDANGNIQDEKVNGNVTKQYDYQGTPQLRQLTAGGVTSKYWYDDVGRLHCVTTAAATSDADCKTGSTGPSDLLADYEYDYLDRLQSYQAYSNGSQTDHATYTYDALDRLASEDELHPSFTGSTRTTQFSYLGLGGLLTEEQQSNSTGVLDTKDYSYDAYGHRLSQTVTGSVLPSVPNGTSTYGYDMHGSVSQLVDANGSSQASYGYKPYGQSDGGLTQGDPDPLNPVSSFRFSAKHVDTGSNTLDMGVRRFGPDTSRFLTPDLFYGALSNLTLSVDPLTQNRYGLAGGNPIGYREWDGHMVLADDGGGASAAPQSPPVRSCDCWWRDTNYAPVDYGGAKSSNYDFTFTPQPGVGTVTVGIFIPTKTAGYGIGGYGLTNRGDDRGFDPNADPSRNRGYIRLDFERGQGELIVNPSCTAEGKQCQSADEIVSGVDGTGIPGRNTIDVTQADNGALTVQVNLRNSMPIARTPFGNVNVATSPLEPPISNTFTFTPSQGGKLSVYGSGSLYPSVEVYEHQGGRTTTLVQEPAAWQGVEALYLQSRTYRYPQPEYGCSGTYIRWGGC